MPFYKLVKRDIVVGKVEVSTHGMVKQTTGQQLWAINKPLTDLADWCGRKQIALSLIIDSEEIKTACRELHPIREGA